MEVNQLKIGSWYSYINCKKDIVYCVYIGMDSYCGYWYLFKGLNKYECPFSRVGVEKFLCLPPRHLSEYLNLFECPRWEIK